MTAIGTRYFTVFLALATLLAAACAGAAPPTEPAAAGGAETGAAPIPTTPRILPEVPIRIGGVYTSGLSGSPDTPRAARSVGRLSDANRDWIAANCDVIALNAEDVTPETFPSIVKQQKLFTPLLYVYASSLYEADHRGNAGGWAPAMAEWTLRNREGKEVPHPDAGAHWMDFSSHAWAEHWSRQVTGLVNQYGAYGVVAAELPLGNTFAGDDLLKYRDAKDRAAATRQWLEAARPAFPNLLIPSAIGFDLAAGHPTPEPKLAFSMPALSVRLWNDYFTLTDGAWCEGWVQPYWEDKPVSESLWETQMEAADRAGRLGQVFIATAGYHNDEELEFVLASYLHVVHHQGRMVFQPMPIRPGEPADAGFNLAVLQRELREKPQFFRMHLGVGMQDRHKVPAVGGSVWRRNFQYGDVYINSSEDRTVRVQFAGKMKRLNGKTVTQVTLGPHTAAILRYP